MVSYNRRTLLGVAAGTATSTVTGCLSGDSTDGDGTTSQETSAKDGTGSTTTGDGATDGRTTSEDDSTTASGDEATATLDAFAYRSWYPAPSELDTDTYWTYYVDASTTTSTNISDAADRRLRELFYQFPTDVLAYDDASEFVSFGIGGAIASFDVDTATVRDALTEYVGGDSTESSPPAGYEAYGDGQYLFWLGSDHVLFGNSSDTLSTFHAARNGEIPRYGEETDFGLVLDAVGDGAIVAGRAGNQQFVSESSAFAYRWRFSNGTANMKTAFAFESESAVDTDSVSGLTEEDGFVEYGDFQQSTSGRVSTLDAGIDYSEFDLLARENDEDTGTRVATPQVAFEYEFDQGTDGEWNGEAEERVVITHTGGDNVEVKNVTVRYDGVDVSDASILESTPPSDTTWSAGGQWTLQIDATDASFESGKTVSVVWTSPDDSKAAVLSQGTLP